MGDMISERCEAAYRTLVEALDGVGEEEAGAFRVPGWPEHEGAVGEDGSIAGLVWHCAAWKGMWVGYFDTGAYPERASLRPEEDSWTGRRAWLEALHTRLMEHLRRYDGQEEAQIHGKPCRLGDYDISNGEHDTYHAAQIWYLRQRWLARQRNP